MEFWLVKSPVLLLGAPEVTVFIEWALQQSVPLSTTSACGMWCLIKGQHG
jgi:hypothetical protein